jgi:hypothetical protein
MGLDVRAYELVEPLHELTGSQVLSDDLISLRPHAQFPAQADGIERGWYRVSGEQTEFWASSYAGYGWWRSELAKMTGTTVEAIRSQKLAGPFVELIAFSDAEGIIGSSTSAKLARDFGEWRARAVEHSRKLGDVWFDHDFEPALPTTGAQWLETYDRFHKAFEIARYAGVVKLC